MNSEEIKTKIQEEVEARRQELIGLSMKIHTNPELGFKEVKAAGWLTDYLEKNGFKVERGVCDLPTAFRAIYGEGKPVIAFSAEYDALPTIGHGCGHNIIASAAVGAAMAAKSLADQFGAKILVFGCPAEELMGGKVIMAEKGAWNGVDANLQIHCVPKPANWGGFYSTGCIPIEVEYFGIESHAAVSPWEGVNALEAMILAFNNLNGLRLHVKDKARIAGIITDGGEVPNTIPGHAAGKFMIRAPEDAYLDELREKVIKCFEAAALATAARLEYRLGMRCYALQTNSTLLELWTQNMATLGRKVVEIQENSGSTDIGNVSVVVPAIHPFLSVSKEDHAFHSPEFREDACSDLGKEAVIDGAKALAMTAADVITQPEALSRMKEEFAEMQKTL